MQSGQRLAEVSDRGATPSCRPVLLATDEQRRHGNRLARECGKICPVAVDVAISIESAGEAGALKLADVEVEVFCGQPTWQLFRDREPVAHPAAVRNRGHSAAGGRRWRVARGAVVKAQEPTADVGLDLSFGAARLLKVLQSAEQGKPLPNVPTGYPRTGSTVHGARNSIMNEDAIF
jgi:hypothetical protein